MRRKEINYSVFIARQKRWRLFNIDIENYAFSYPPESLQRLSLGNIFFLLSLRHPEADMQQSKKCFIKFKFIVCDEVIVLYFYSVLPFFLFILPSYFFVLLMKISHKTDCELLKSSEADETSATRRLRLRKTIYQNKFNRVETLMVGVERNSLNDCRKGCPHVSWHWRRKKRLERRFRKRIFLKVLEKCLILGGCSLNTEFSYFSPTLSLANFVNS